MDLEYELKARGFKQSKKKPYLWYKREEKRTVYFDTNQLEAYAYGEDGSKGDVSNEMRILIRAAKLDNDKAQQRLF